MDWLKETKANEKNEAMKPTIVTNEAGTEIRGAEVNVVNQRQNGQELNTASAGHVHTSKEANVTPTRLTFPLMETEKNTMRERRPNKSPHSFRFWRKESKTRKTM